jgi:hypothetical protein
MYLFSIERNGLQENVFSKLASEPRAPAKKSRPDSKNSLQSAQEQYCAGRELHIFDVFKLH